MYMCVHACGQNLIPVFFINAPTLFTEARYLSEVRLRNVVSQSSQLV